MCRVDDVFVPLELSRIFGRRKSVKNEKSNLGARCAPGAVRASNYLLNVHTAVPLGPTRVSQRAQHTTDRTNRAAPQRGRHATGGIEKIGPTHNGVAMSRIEQIDPHNGVPTPRIEQIGPPTTRSTPQKGCHVTDTTNRSANGVAMAWIEQIGVSSNGVTPSVSA